MRPQTLLPILIGVAVGAAGVLHGLKLERAAKSEDAAELRTTISSLEEQVAMLERENESLRSLAQGGGELKVPAPLIEFAEKAAGLDFRSTPVVHRLAGEELLERVAASIESRFPPNSLDHREAAWAKMGLLAPDDRFAGQVAATYSLGARSWFDDQTGEAWVTDRFDESSVPDQSALLRALVRILLHQHYPPAPGYAGDEADRARTALHHGTAISIETRFLARQALGIGFTGTQDRSEAADLLNNLPVYIRGLATFPSQLGAAVAGRLMEQEKLLEALHQPPTTTARFAPDLDGIEARAIELPASNDEPVLEETAGWLGLKLWLETLDPALAVHADGWRGDRYQLTARSDTQLDLVWDIELADAATAEAVARAGCAMAGFLAGSDRDANPDEVIKTPEGDRISITRPTETRVRFTHLGPE
ncbi:hypothetical protein [Haloferula sp. A504]|uniref:hypothetical protein n=1 Tax=Haloferula sp. A504 TaxID=3373601 RepID=UPI0031C92D3F|nr:hypothetical protein [Verrucomicrobiaceae bacterium E54]